jgi:hypothetical protein
MDILEQLSDETKNSLTIVDEFLSKFMDSIAKDDFDPDKGAFINMRVCCVSGGIEDYINFHHEAIKKAVATPTFDVHLISYKNVKTGLLFDIYDVLYQATDLDMA